MEQLLHRQLLAHLDAGVASVGREVGDGALGRHQHGVHFQFAGVHRLQHQKGGHDLGETGGVKLFVDVAGVEDLTGVGIGQESGLGRDLPVTHIVGCGPDGQSHAAQEQQGEKKR